MIHPNKYSKEIKKSAKKIDDQKATKRKKLSIVKFAIFLGIPADILYWEVKRLEQ